MIIYDSKWNPIEEPDLELGYVEPREQELFAAYTVTKEGEGEYVTIKEYDTGGKDVEWRWTVEPEGEWRFYGEDETEWANPPKPPIEDWWSQDEAYPCFVAWQLYTPYTDDELEKRAAEKAEQEQQEAEAKAQTEEMMALPDAVAELSELAANNETSAADLADAIADLSQLVSDLLEDNNG